MNVSPVLLDDAAMRRFIIEGYLILHPEFPQGFHEDVYRKIEKEFATGRNPDNNCLPCVPDLQQVFDHPVVHGALSSLLGPDYYLHLHRHIHDNPPGSKGQGLHKDSLYNSRFAVDDQRRHHRTRWIMAFYYPQDTPVELGPTGILPRSQYLNVSRPVGMEEVALTGDAGTVVLVHYDLLHRGMANVSDRLRYMVKFLFTRMSEPQSPDWNHASPDWEPTGDPQESIWRHLWDWHRGVPDTQQPSSNESVECLAECLGSDIEIDGLNAAYELGLRGEEGIPRLIDALKAEKIAASRNAAYAFDRIGPPAVPALLDAAGDENEKVRARALDILGDMGLTARDAVPTLLDSLHEEADDPRQRAVEALGTAGQGEEGIAGRLGECLLHDSNGNVRRNAALSLARLGSKAAGAESALARGTMDANHYARGYSVHALSRIGTPAAQQALMKYLQVTRWDWDRH